MDSHGLHKWVSKFSNNSVPRFRTDQTATHDLNQSSIINTLKQSVKLKKDETPTSRSLSELLKIGTYALASLRRATFLLVPKNSDGRIAEKPREKSHTLSLKSQISSFCKLFFLLHVFLPFFNLRRQPLCTILSYYHLTIHLMPSNLGFPTFGVISVVHFHHLSTHATYLT